MRYPLIYIFLLVTLAAPAALAQQYWYSADYERGREAFERQCASCHTLGKGGSYKNAPSLYGIYGQEIASHPDYNEYSFAFRRQNLAWDFYTLNPFLRAPDHFIPGNIMHHDPVSDPQTRADIIYFLYALPHVD